MHTRTHAHAHTHAHTHTHTHTHTQGEVKLPFPRLHVDFPLLLMDSRVVIVADHGYRTTTQQS